MSHFNDYSDESGKDESSQGEEFPVKQENDSTQSDEYREQTKSVAKVEDDETLLNEVDEEMARGVVVPAKISSAQQTTPITGCPVIPSASSLSLEVVEEKDEAIVGRLEDLEENVDRLNQIIRDTELCLQQVNIISKTMARNLVFNLPIV